MRYQNRQQRGGGENHQTPPQQVVYRRDKSEGIAAVLSLLWPGLGQIYVSRIGRGLGIMVLGFVIAFLAILFFWLIFPLILPLVYWIWNIFDAHKLAKEYNTFLEATGKRPW